MKRINTLQLKVDEIELPVGCAKTAIGVRVAPESVAHKCYLVMTINTTGPGTCVPWSIFSP